MVACNPDKIEKLDFDDLLEKRYQELIDKQLSECQSKAEIEAEQRIDSLIDKLLKTDLLDTLEFPEKPARPDRPSDFYKEK